MHPARPDFQCHGHSGKAIGLLPKLHAFPAPLRAVSVGATRLTDGKVVQLSLFDEEFSEREDRLEKSVDAIRNKYGYKAVKRGVNIGDDLTGGLHGEDDFLPFKR